MNRDAYRELDIEESTRIHIARDMLRPIYTRTVDQDKPLDGRVKEELGAILSRLDQLAFAVRYPAKAEKNGTLSGDKRWDAFTSEHLNETI